MGLVPSSSRGSSTTTLTALNVRSGTGTIALASNTVTVVLSSAMPDANYGVEITCTQAGQVVAANSLVRVINKTTLGFDVVLLSPTSGAVTNATGNALTFDYEVIPYT